MNNTYFGFMEGAATPRFGRGLRIHFSFKVVKDKAFFILVDFYLQNVS